MNGIGAQHKRRAAAGIAIVALLVGLASTAAAEPVRLDVSVAVFDPGVPEDLALQRDLQVFPRIRAIEAKLLPFVLRDVLEKAGGWGAVRVVPETDQEAELLVSGTIRRSDGDALELDVRAVDASGHVWLERSFAGVTGDPALYSRIAAELAVVRDGFEPAALERIAEISLLRYAAWLAPSAFGDYLAEEGDGRFELRRLPARDDPMLERIRRVRETEYVITDAVDAKFNELQDEIGSVYRVWREYRRKNIEYQVQGARRAEVSRTRAPLDSFEDLLARYENYKFDRTVAQEQDSLAVAFDNEVSLRVAAMETRVAELQAWVDQKYAEWHRLLEALYEAETEVER